MYKTSNAIWGSPQATIATKKRDDGMWEATITSQTTIPVTVAPTESEAINGAKQAFQRAMMSGNVEGT